MTTTAAGERSLARDTRRAPSFVVTIIALASFGPYLIGSIRTEQAVVYGLLLALSPVVLARFRVYVGKRFFLPWLGYVLVATISVVAPASAPMPHEAGSLLGGYDNILAPLAVMMLIWSVVPEGDAGRLLVRLCKVVAIVMALNGALAIIATAVDISAMLRPFWANEGSETTADLAAQMGRYSGIFNQPSEAGALYGIAGLGAVYAWQSRAALSAFLITLITLGGLISVSKIFIFGGLPAIAIFWFWTQRGGRKIAGLFGLMLIAGGVLQSGVFDGWIGANYLGRLFVTPANQGFIDLYGAGRFDESSSFSTVIDHVLKFNPLTGVGAAGWAEPYDGAVAEFLVTGGVFGLLFLFVVLVALFALPSQFDGSTRWFAFLFAVVTAGGSLGFSPLTANRVSTITWMVIALLVLMARSRASEKGPNGPIRHD